MDLKTHNTTQTLNERVIVLIWELKEHFGDDPELPRIQEDLKRVSKYLLLKSLKTFNDENNKI